MYALLLAATLGHTPALPAAAELAPLVRAQQAIAMRDIRIEIQANLERRGAAFLAREGGLQALLRNSVIVETEVAAR